MAKSSKKLKTSAPRLDFSLHAGELQVPLGQKDGQVVRLHIEVAARLVGTCSFPCSLFSVVGFDGGDGVLLPTF